MLSLNDPLGAFVASAGLESFVAHGFMTPTATTTGRKNDKLEYTAEFIRDSLASYAKAALPFVSDAHILVQEDIDSYIALASRESSYEVLRGLRALDDLWGWCDEAIVSANIHIFGGLP